MVPPVDTALSTHIARLTKDSSQEAFAELAERVNTLSAAQVVNLLSRLKKTTSCHCVPIIRKRPGVGSL